MKRVFITVAAIFGFGVGSALAADMPVKAKTVPPAPTYGWSGPYVGLNAGGAWSDPYVEWTGNPAGFGGAALASEVNNAGTRHLNGSGFVGGGQLGYNYQINRVLVGIEGDIDYTGTRGSYDSSVFFPVAGASGSVSESFSTGWLATLRGRLGFVHGPWLVYGTGGLAVGRVKFSDYVFFNASGTFNSANRAETRAGWTAGGGVEWAFAPRWTVKVEYLYVDLGKVDYTSANSSPAFPLATIQHHHEFTENIARLGVNFRF